MVRYPVFDLRARARGEKPPRLWRLLRYLQVMEQVVFRLNRAVAALAVLLLCLLAPAAALSAQEREATVDVSALLDQLANPAEARWRRIERQILQQWSRSGSATADYLFQRGQAALQAGQPDVAIAHFSAVIDHAPDFTEAWNARATAWYMSNRLGQSMADIEVVLSREPRHFGALSGLGMILEQTERLEAARAAYAAAHAVHPHRPQLREAVARLDLALAGRAL
jgi:tetratricopeptide (TPR) repeat protein